MTGKRPEDLVFKPDPPPEDFRTSDWYCFSKEIDDILATGRYSWAEDTLEDIQKTVEDTQRVTEGQRRAVKNIEEARSDRVRTGASHRYRWRNEGRPRGR